MIDIHTEDVLTLAEAAKILPRRRGGKKVSTSSLFRWATTGLRGIRLEAIQLSGSRCTSKQALTRFFVALSEQSGLYQGDPGATTPTAQTAPQSPDDRAAAIEAAEKRLQEAGC